MEKNIEKDKEKKQSIRLNSIKTNKGITLIALVITIIVLLILAGVTIATLAGDNGILSRATGAREQTDIAEEKEKVVLAVQTALIDNKGKEILQQHLEKELENSFGKNKYGVEEGENEEEQGDIVSITDTGRRYFVSKNGKVEQMIPGPIVTHTINPDTRVEPGGTVTITINATATEGELTKITKPDGSVENNVLQVIYDVETNGKYKFIVEQSNGGKTTYTVEIKNIRPKTVEDLKVGEKVNYIDKNGNIVECIVLYDTEYNQENETDYGVQVISSDIVDNVTLGYGDPTATGTNNAAKARVSYNNSIQTLNNKVEEYLNETYAMNSRCAGSIPNDKNFVGNGSINTYETDFNQMRELGIIKVSSEYWLASRDSVYSKGKHYRVYYISSAGGLKEHDLLYHNLTADDYPYSYSLALRSVFTLKPELKLVDGDGVNTPYTLQP